jgi:hypothetical protein
MSDIARVLVSAALLFGGSVLVSYSIAVFMSARRHRFDIKSGATLRLVGPGGAYRCQFIERRKDALVVSSPIQADRFVPIRSGERIIVQVPSEQCVINFSTVVLSRDSDRHELVLKWPSTVRRIERRSEKRSEALSGEDALLDGEVASLIDLSAAGASLVTRKRPNPGDRVRVVLPSSGLDAYGWTLDSTHAPFGNTPGYKIRVQFEEPLSGLARKT